MRSYFSLKRWGARAAWGGRGKNGWGCLLDDLRGFGINADQWTTAAQDEGKWCKTAEQGAKRFMAKLIAAENARAGLMHAVYYIIVCPNVAGRIKERTPKASVLVLVRSP